MLATSRRPGTVAAAFAAVGLLWGLGPGAGLTDAARYTVAQCGWRVGNDGDWYQSAADKFHSSAWCAVPEGSDPWDGIHTSSGTRPSTNSTSGTRFARWRWQAPAGTGIVTVSGDRWHVLRDGFRHRLGHAGNGSFTPFAEFTETDSTRRYFSQAFSPPAAAFESRLLCAKPENSSCQLDGTALAGVRALTMTLDDPSRPAPTVTGLPGEGAWVRGTIGFGFQVSDVGSGVKQSSSSVDGSAFATSTHPCSEALIAGQWRATRMQPCSTQATGSQTLDTTRLGDGPHLFDHCASDFAANFACTGQRTLLTDNTAPSAPRRLTVDGGDGWRRVNDFDFAWEVPDQGRAAPITRAHFRVDGPTGQVSAPQPAARINALDSLKAPAAGEYSVSVWIEDAAGNFNPAADASQPFRLDDVPPTARLVAPEASDPDLLTVPVSDLHSGVAGGAIEIRHQSSGEWEKLVTEFDRTAGRLSADFASERRTPGRWEVRAKVTDEAGNQTVVDRLPDGSPLQVIAPARSQTELIAKLAGGGEPAPSIIVPFGEGARVQGRLLDRGGDGLGNHDLRVVESPAEGVSGDPAVHAVTTAADGGFALGLPPGPSRRVTVHFAGTKRLMSSSSGTLELGVRAVVGFSARPRKLRNGQVIRFDGTIRPLLAARHSGGSLVEVQYLETSSGRWRPVLVTRVRRVGTFAASYRFRYVSRATRIKFRARMLAAPGLPFATGISRVVRVTVTGD
ncbi:MAG: hypothetical protein ACKORM_03255 [Solirubrobacterales bacterium]